MYFLYVAGLIIFVVVLFSISSRVRQAARLAFEAEMVEADDFAVLKPEGFINPINDKSLYAFEAYSKDFGKGEAENLRQAEAWVSVLKTESYAEAGARIRKSAGENLPEEPDVPISGMSRETLENAVTCNFYKIIDSKKNQKVYELKITVLEDFLDDYQNRVDEMLESFRLK